MKVIALMPVKNESWILPYTLSSLKDYVDEIIILDDSSTDNSVDIAKKFSARIYYSNDIKNKRNFSSLRNHLLDLGRKHNGTHFIFLDADEAFSGNFIYNFRKILKNMNTGDIISLRWLSMWKSQYHYRNDNTIYAISRKDFIFCDDGHSIYDNQWIHENRTPGKKTNVTEIELNDGCVLHYQFINWYKYQMKQIWYRCIELKNNSNSVHKINRTYMFTLKENLEVNKILPEWKPNFIIDDDVFLSKESWHYNEIIKLFNENNIEYFERLDIWHLPILRNEFIKRTGHKPKKTNWDIIMKLIAKIYYKFKGY